MEIHGMGCSNMLLTMLSFGAKAIAEEYIWSGAMSIIPTFCKIKHLASEMKRAASVLSLV
jgi:hypothetical protein